jgi:hypothetical protein
MNGGRGETLYVYSYDRVSRFDSDLKFLGSQTGPRAGIRGTPLSMAWLSDGKTAEVTANIERGGSGQFLYPVYIRDSGAAAPKRLQIGDVVDGAQRVRVAAARDSGRFWAVGLTNGGGYFVAMYDQSGQEL